MSLRERIAQGDKQALAEAYARFRPLVFRMLAERRRSPSDFEDLAQEAFLRLPECARACSPATTMGGCVATATLQALRRWDCRSATSDQTQPGRASRRVELDQSALLATADGGASPEEVLLQRERAHLLSELVLQLPAGQRLVLWVREVEGLSGEAAAERLGVSPRSVGTLTLKARRALEARAAEGPLAEVFAAMPKHGERGQSRATRWRRRKQQQEEVAS